MTGGIEESGIFTAIWWVIATLTVVAALLVVFLQDLVKAAMALIGTFLGIAGLFVMLNAEFLAVVHGTFAIDMARPFSPKKDRR